jgi:endothelin-converting enzyme
MYLSFTSLKMLVSTDGGWVNSHILPPDKGKWGIFDVLANQNRRVIHEILQADPPIPSPSLDAQDYDALILGKLRGLYNSCMDEKQLNHLGQKPLVRVAQIVRRLFREKGTTIEPQSNEEEIPFAQGLKGTGLTAAIAYLHSRGMSSNQKYHE